jgi:hypothetical protein
MAASDTINKPKPPAPAAVGIMLDEVVVTASPIAKAIPFIGWGFAGWQAGSQLAKHIQGFSFSLAGILMKLGVSPNALMPPNARPGVLNSEQAIDDLKNGAEKIKVKNQKDNEFYEKEGGKDQADRDFDNIADPSTVKPIPGGRIGRLPDGTPINVRDGSTDGRPTLEVQKPNGTKIKFRYNNE